MSKLGLKFSVVARRWLGSSLRLRAIVVFFLSFTPVLFAQEEAKISNSPDKAFFAAVRSMPEPQFIWKSDLDGFRLVIFHRKSADELGEFYFAGDVSARSVAKCQWSPDSKYLVISTSSTDSHSPDHFETFVFSVDEKDLRRIDDLTGPIRSFNFRFEAPSTVFVKVRASENSSVNHIVRVPLMENFCKLHEMD